VTVLYVISMIVSITPELALDEGTPFAGGLGVLEGDKFYAASRLRLPYTVITLFYRKGYVDYEFRDGMAEPADVPFSRKLQSRMKALEGSVNIFGREVKTRYLVFEKGSARAVFIDAIAPAWARRLNEHLYEHQDTDISFARYVLLAEGAIDYLIRSKTKVEFIDMQEAYATLVAISPNLKKLEKARLRFIIHTPGPWGHPSFPRHYFSRNYGYDFLHEKVYLTDIGLATAEHVFCVSKKHFEITKSVMPHFAAKISYVTNGIEMNRWKKVDEEHFESSKNEARKVLLRKTGLSGDGMVLAWNRRIVGYKRPEFILRFIEECDEDVLFILAGKAHPQDMLNREVMEQFWDLSQRKKNVFYTPDYSTELAGMIAAGADLMVFTPFSGWESSGTSFMKGMVNGTPCLSSRDGAVVEFIRDGENGWLYGRNLKKLIDPGSEEGRRISARDYREFSSKLKRIIKLWQDERDRFNEIAINAMRTGNMEMDRVLRSYYGELWKIN